MRNFILSLIWVILAAMPMLNAQQASPNQTTATQQPSKPKAAGNRPFPQPKVQPTQPTTPNNNPGQKKGVANNPGYGKPADNNPENGKTTDNNVRPGKTTGNDTGHGKTTNNNGDSYADTMRRYRHDRHDHDWWKQHYVLSCWSEADTIITTRDIGILHGDTILIMSAMITMDRFTPMAICCRTRSS